MRHLLKPLPLLLLLSLVLAIPVQGQPKQNARSIAGVPIDFADVLTCKDPGATAEVLTCNASGEFDLQSGGIVGATGGDPFLIDPDEDATVEVTINSCASADAFVVEATTCDIGMGTASPTKPLHVVGDILITSPGDQLTIDSGGGAYVDPESSGANADTVIRFTNASTAEWTIGRIANVDSYVIVDGNQAGTQIVNIADGSLASSLLIDSTGVTILQSTAAGITASVTQTQGQQALTAVINQVSVVANTGDVVTMPGATAGLPCTVINDGANSLQIFPESGDDVGDGVDISMLLEANETVKFVALDGTVWHIESETEIFHAEMEQGSNTTAYAVTAQNNAEVYHSATLVAGDLAEWTFDAGGAGTTFPIASIADAGGGDITVTTTGSHTLAVGAIISQANLADAAYEGVFQVLTVPLATTYTVTAVFTATDTGTMQEAATLTALPSAAGVYQIHGHGSGSAETNNDIFTFQVRKNATVDNVPWKRTFAVGADFGGFPLALGTISIASGDKISLDLTNTSGAGDLTFFSMAVILIRL